MDSNPGRIKLVLRYAPFHDGADYFVKILEAAGRQGKYWETLEVMYRSQPYWASHHNPRPELIWRLLCRQPAAQDATGQTLDLFAAAQGGAATAAPPPRPPQYDERTTLRHEVEALGFLASRHPLSMYEEELSGTPHVAGRDLNAHAGQRITTVGWYVTGKTVTTRQGNPMEFISFEDTTAIYEAVFFPRAYRRFCQLLTRSRPYLLSGKVEQSFGVATLNVDTVRLLG